MVWDRRMCLQIPENIVGCRLERSCHLTLNRHWIEAVNGPGRSFSDEIGERHSDFYLNRVRGAHRSALWSNKSSKSAKAIRNAASGISYYLTLVLTRKGHKCPLEVLLLSFLNARRYRAHAWYFFPKHSLLTFWLRKWSGHVRSGHQSRLFDPTLEKKR